MGTYIPNSLPRPIFAISHALKSLWDGMSVSWQGFCATRLNIFKCLHNRTPEASLFGSSYCQDFPKYEADHINTNCSHPPDRSAGGKEKKKEKEKSVWHLLQVLQRLWAEKQHKPARSSCTECAVKQGQLRNSTKWGENPDKLEPETTFPDVMHWQISSLPVFF